MTGRVVVIGGGPAAVSAAIAAKKLDAEANVTLITEEACEPYEKPPLSKAVLLGTAKPEDAPIAGVGGLAKHNVTVEFDCRCTVIERDKHRLLTTKGPMPYDALVVATGSIMRELPILPIGTPGVHYLRTEAQARAIKADLGPGKRMVVIGAGLIGLEAAASAAEIGAEVTVIDVAPRIMERVCDRETAAIVQAEHERHGVKFILSTSVIRSNRKDDGTIVLETDHGVHTADLVLVGIGVRPNDEVAVSAALDVRDGIVVDAKCRTSDPYIFAAGDVASFETPFGIRRLENWRHAQEHGGVAGRNAAGASDAYSVVPSFWSEQYDLYIQGVGWPDPVATHVRRPLPDKSVLVIGANNGVVSNALGINVQRDLAAIRRLIERKIPIDIAHLADPLRPFADMLKVRA
jgi:NADPH-dependent 2,4-dienoyl-CoA reductase/sulfur reductase-like enzyme